MKLMLSLLITLVIICPSTASYAGKKDQAQAKAGTQATAVVPSPAQPITYPYTFTCTHCGVKVTVKNADEWKKACEACACGMSNADCAPKKK